MKSAVIANIRLAVRADTTDPVELWLVRLNPQARPRFLTLLYGFLDYCGYDPPAVSQILAEAAQDPWKMYQTIKAYTAALSEFRTERVFAYTGLRSFFSRCRIYLPSESHYDPGGRLDEWWL